MRALDFLHVTRISTFTHVFASLLFRPEFVSCRGTHHTENARWSPACPANRDRKCHVGPFWTLELAACDLYYCEHKNKMRAAKVRGIRVFSKDHPKCGRTGGRRELPWIVGLSFTSPRLPKNMKIQFFLSQAFRFLRIRGVSVKRSAQPGGPGEYS